jgi:cytochrome c-type biogenesis protein CcmH/NrfG
MKKISVIWSLCLLIILIAQVVPAQSDETRQASGLPIKIGENVDNTNKTNLTGKVQLEGFDTSQPAPIVVVTATSSGLTVGRRRIADNGTYFLLGIPRDNVTIIIEVNGQEVLRQQLLTAVHGNIRQDFTIPAAQWTTAKSKAEIISAGSFYPRSAENEKLFEKATSAARDKKTDNAIKLFKQIVESDPKDFVVWTDFGTLYFRGDKFSEAEKCYLTALEHKPDFMLAQLNLSRLYLTQKQPEKVIQILTKALETQPNSADANHYLGEAYLQAKLGSKAIIYLNAAIQLAPIEKAELHLRLGWLYNAAGLKDRAALEYKQFLAKVPKYAEKEKLEKYINENLPPQ